MTAGVADFDTGKQLVKEHLFVVRIWREYREIEGEEPRFRGMIQHAVTGEKQYFNDISYIAAFLAAHLNLPEGPPYQAPILKEQLQPFPAKEPGEQDGSL
jgi:hypothetical protein